MVYKEEVFNYFKELSGAKRIELMCGLMSMCIPLEIRFFETVLKELAKKDMNALREAELKANSFSEMDSICKCDLLADIQVITESNDLKPNPTNCETNVIQTNCSLNNTQPLHQSSQVMPIQDMSAVAANGTAVLAQNDMMAIVSTPTTPNPSPNVAQLPSRSRLIVSMCLLSPTNRNCSTITYKALQTQLTAPKIAAVVTRCLAYRKSMYELEDLFSGVLLLLTMALHSPAFSFEQRDLLSKQKEEVERTIDNIRSTYYRQQNPNYTPNAHPFQSFAPHPQGVHSGQSSHIHPHISAHTTQTQSTAVGVGGQAAHSHTHSHTHPAVAQMPVPSQQYQQYMSTMPVTVTNMNYSSNPLPNMTNLRISNISSPVSTPSPSNSPSSSKSTVTSVAAISPLPMSAEFMGHGIGIKLSETVPNQASYVLTAGISSLPQSLKEEMSCSGSAKSIISCYNCGSSGHRGEECTTQSQEEANR